MRGARNTFIGTGLLFALFAISMTLPSVAAGSSSDDLSVEAARRGTGGATVIFIELVNRSPGPVYDVAVQLREGLAVKHTRSFPVFAHGQATVVSFQGRGWTPSSNVLVSYRRGSLTNSIVTWPSSATVRNSNTVSSWLVMGPALISFVGVVLGAVLLHVLTARRDKVRARFEWRRLLFEKQQEAYAAFRASWSGVLVPQVLDNSYTELASKIIVDESVIGAYKKLRTVLSDQVSTDAAKRAAARKLDASFTKLLTP